MAAGNVATAVRQQVMPSENQPDLDRVMIRLAGPDMPSSPGHMQELQAQHVTVIDIIHDCRAC